MRWIVLGFFLLVGGGSIVKGQSRAEIDALVAKIKATPGSDACYDLDKLAGFGLAAGSAAPTLIGILDDPRAY